MGLAPYGRPVYKDLITKHLIDLQAGRQLLAGHAVLQLLPGPDDDEPAVRRAVRRAAAQSGVGRSSSGTWIWPRASRRSPRTRCWRSAASCSRETGMRNLVLAGGVALNCVANGRLLREGPFDDIWIQPAAGDAGGALGAALFVWHQLLEKPRATARHAIARRAASSGPRFAIDGHLRASSTAPARRTAARRARAELLEQVVDLLVAGEDRRLVPGPDGVRSARARRAQHPRRSALAEDAGDDEPEDQVPRELPAVRADACCRTKRIDWFELEPGQESPYMLLVAPVLERASRADRPTSSARRWRAIRICATA